MIATLSHSHHTPDSWSKVHQGDIPDGSEDQKQYWAYDCQGNEDELSSCNLFEYPNTPSNIYDIGLRCTFVVAGDECEECPAGKYRYVRVFVCV